MMAVAVDEYADDERRVMSRSDDVEYVTAATPWLILTVDGHTAMRIFPCPWYATVTPSVMAISHPPRPTTTVWFEPKRAERRGLGDSTDGVRTTPSQAVEGKPRTPWMTTKITSIQLSNILPTSLIPVTRNEKNGSMSGVHMRMVSSPKRLQRRKVISGI
jgi:hypothetical protein